MLCISSLLVASRARVPFFIQERTNSQEAFVKRKKKEIIRIIFLAKMKIQPFFLLFFICVREIFFLLFFIKNCPPFLRVVPLFCLNIIIVLVETT